MLFYGDADIKSCGAFAPAWEPPPKGPKQKYLILIRLMQPYRHSTPDRQLTKGECSQVGSANRMLSRISLCAPYESMGIH